MWAAIKEGYEGLVMTVIRPMRAQYALEDLGPKHALINDVVTHRVDMQLKNDGGYTLQCSWWKPSTTEKGCVLLIGNAIMKSYTLTVICFFIDCTVEPSCRVS